MTRMAQIDCKQAAEILPWLLNGSLAAEERIAAREHLSRCAQCQREFQETAFTAAVHGQHIPEEALIDYVFDRPSQEMDSGMIERHLDVCEQCVAELELLEESHRLMNADESVSTFRPRTSKKPIAPIEEVAPPRAPYQLWTYGAIAASVIGFIAIIGWWWSWRQASSLDAQRLAISRRVAGLEADNQQLRQAQPETTKQLDQANREIASLKARVDELTAPQINIPVLEIMPQEMTERGEPSRINSVQIPGGARAVTLILNSQSASESKNYSMEILDARRNMVWSQQGLTRHATGDYTINIPAGLLPPNEYTINIYSQSGGKRVKIESYRIRIAG